MKIFPVLGLSALFLVSCSEKSASNSDLPFAPPHGWISAADKSSGLGLEYRNSNEPNQSFRYLLLRFARPPRLTQEQIAEEIQSISQEPVSLESLGGRSYFAELSNTTEHEGQTLFRRQFFRVDKVSTTTAEVRVVSFFCPPAEVGTTKSVQDAIWKGLHDAPRTN